EQEGGFAGGLPQRGRQDRRRRPGQRRGKQRGGQGQVPARQAGPQQVAPPGQPRRNGPRGAAEFLSRLLVGFSFQVAEHAGRWIFLGQPIEFLVQGRPQFPPEGIGRRFGGGQVLQRPFA